VTPRWPALAGAIDVAARIFFVEPLGRVAAASADGVYLSRVLGNLEGHNLRPTRIEFIDGLVAVESVFGLEAAPVESVLVEQALTVTERHLQLLEGSYETFRR
jgi:hypothetical protein